MLPGSYFPIEPRLRNRSIAVPWSGCVIWLGACSPNGYGVIGVRGGLQSTHRAAWEVAHGLVPAGMFVLHRCDVRCCINTAHLFLGKHLENARDAQAKGRNAKGERHGNAVLTDAQVTAIRADSRSSRLTSKDYGVSPRYIRSLRRGDWRV